MFDFFSYFSSRSVLEHLARGLLAFACVWAALRTEHLVWPLFIFLPAAFLLWRGCPSCWTLGLIDTIRRKITGKPPGESWTSCACTIARKKFKKPKSVTQPE